MFNRDKKKINSCEYFRKACSNYLIVVSLYNMTKITTLQFFYKVVFNLKSMVYYTSICKFKFVNDVSR